MKKISFLAAALLFALPLFAQNDDKDVTITRQRQVMTGTELQKMFGGVKDPNIYDIDGKVVDSAEAAKMLKTYQYQISFSRKNGQEEFKRTISKIDSLKQMAIDETTKRIMRPKNPKLQEGQVLNIKPLTKRIDRKTLEGKALVLIFWCSGCYGGKDSFREINEVLSGYMNPEKLQVLAITHHPMEAAKTGLEQNPIVNTTHIIDASDITKEYDTENRPLVILTDQDHKILYTVANGSAAMTPRILYQSLKRIL